jgi:hypothetical protein
MVCFHRRYSLGDGYRNGKPDNRGFDSPGLFQDWWKNNGKGGLLIPLYLYDHSGLTISTKPFSCMWDSGQVGWIYATHATMVKEWGKAGRLTNKSRKQARSCLESEVIEYDQYLTGQVYGYVIKNETGQHISSCLGFFGDEYCETEAKSMAEHCAKSSRAEACQI